MVKDKVIRTYNTIKENHIRNQEIQNYRVKSEDILYDIEQNKVEIEILKDQINSLKKKSNPKLRVSTAYQGDEYTCNICDHGWKTKNHLGLSHKCPSCSSSNIKNKDLIERNNDHKANYYVALEKSKSAKTKIISKTKKIASLEKNNIELNKKLTKSKKKLNDLKENKLKNQSKLSKKVSKSKIAVSKKYSKSKITLRDLFIIAFYLVMVKQFNHGFEDPTMIELLQFTFFRLLIPIPIACITYGMLYRGGKDDPNKRGDLVGKIALGSVILFFGIVWIMDKFFPV